MSHIIKTYIEDGLITKIDYDTGRPSRPAPGKHVKQPPHEKLRWENCADTGTLTIKFDDSPFESGRTELAALPGKRTTLEELIEADPDPITGDNPVFPYTITLGAITVDPDIIIDLGTGGGARPHKKAAKHAKKAGAPKKRKK